MIHRATVLPCGIKVDDQLCREARHRAVDAGPSLSGWIVGILKKELSEGYHPKPATLLEALGNDELADIDFEFPREKKGVPEIDFA